MSQISLTAYERMASSYIDFGLAAMPKWFRDRRNQSVPVPLFQRDIESLVLAETPSGDPLYRYLALIAPRGSAKTTYLSKCYIAWRIIMAGYVEHIDEYLVIASASFRQAHNWLRSIVESLEASPLVRQYFGPMQRGRYWRFGDGDVEWTFPGGIRVRLRCTGTGMEQRGDQSDNVRPTVYVLDDVTQEQEGGSELAQKSKVDWIIQVVMPALDPDGRIISVGTPRPHPEDWNATVVQRLSRPEIPAESRWELRTYRSIENVGDPTSKVLWPERFPYEKLMGIRQMWREAGRGHLWECEYQCRVVDHEGKTFPTSSYAGGAWAGRLVKTDQGPLLKVDHLGGQAINLEVPVNIQIGFDPAFSKARGSSRTAVYAWGMDSSKELWLIDRWLGRGIGSPEAIAKVLDLAMETQARRVNIEVVAAQEAILQHMEFEYLSRASKGQVEHWVEFKGIHPGTRKSKEDRNKAILETPYRLHRMHHREGYASELEGELDLFPAGTMDTLDATSYAIEGLSRCARNRSDETVPKEQSTIGGDWLTGICYQRSGSKTRRGMVS